MTVKPEAPAVPEELKKLMEESFIRGQKLSIQITREHPKVIKADWGVCLASLVAGYIQNAATPEVPEEKLAQSWLQLLGMFLQEGSYDAERIAEYDAVEVK